jgi:hypothetical protein
MGGVEMLDQDKCHADIGRQRAHKPLARIETTRRGTDADNRKIVRFAKKVIRWWGSSSQSRPGGPGPRRAASWHIHILQWRLPGRKRRQMLSGFPYHGEA